MRCRASRPSGAKRTAAGFAPAGTSKATQPLRDSPGFTSLRKSISVVWQGLTPTAVPGATACGAGAYGDEKTRRAVTANVIIGCLQNDLATGLCTTP